MGLIERVDVSCSPFLRFLPRLGDRNANLSTTKEGGCTFHGVVKEQTGMKTVFCFQFAPPAALTGKSGNLPVFACCYLILPAGAYQ